MVTTRGPRRQRAGTCALEPPWPENVQPDPDSVPPPSASSTAARSTLTATPSSIRSCSNRSPVWDRSEEHTSELQSRGHLVCRLLLEKKKKQLCTHNANAATK